MIEQIIRDINGKFQQMLPSVKAEIPTLEEFALLPGRVIVSDPDVDGELRFQIERSTNYIFLKFSADGNRQQAVQVFKTMMEDKLGLPSSEGGAEDEVLPKQDYDFNQNDDQDVIDIDDDGDAIGLNAVQPYTGTQVGAAKKKIYCVEFRVAAPTGMRGLPRRNERGLPGRGWNPHRQLASPMGMGRGRALPMQRRNPYEIPMD